MSVLDHPLNSQKETESANKYGTLLHQKLSEFYISLKLFNNLCWCMYML